MYSPVRRCQKNECRERAMPSTQPNRARSPRRRRAQPPVSARRARSSAATRRYLICCRPVLIQHGPHVVRGSGRSDECRPRMTMKIDGKMQTPAGRASSPAPSAPALGPAVARSGSCVSAACERSMAKIETRKVSAWSMAHDACPQLVHASGRHRPARRRLARSDADLVQRPAESSDNGRGPPWWAVERLLEAEPASTEMTSGRGHPGACARSLLPLLDLRFTSTSGT